jgi:hypothetical protein
MSTATFFGYISEDSEEIFFLPFFFLPSFLIATPIYQTVCFYTRFFLFSSFGLDAAVTAVAIVDVYTLMTISGIMHLCVEACLTYMKLQRDWTIETM